MQVNLNQSSLDEYLSIIKTFMLETHQRINEECEPPALDPHIVSLIDQASLKLKTQKEQIDILQQQLKEAEIAKITYKDVKSESAHLEKRLNQKADEISILRETVKTLYQDNERISGEKEALAKEVASLKDGSSALRKKLKKQEDEISNHRNELKKLTLSTEDRFAEYLKEDEQKQVTIKKLASELERLKSDHAKKEKAHSNALKKLEELKSVQQEYEKVAKLVERLEQENQYLLTELETTKEKYFEEKGKLMKEADAFKHELSELRERIETYKQENRGLISRIADCEDKNVSYENEIVMRTEKLKEKTRQCRTYGEEVSKLVRRIEELSAMSDEIIIENQDLSNRCRELEAQVEEVRTFQSHISRLKGEVNSKKSAELGKLMDSLGRLQNHA